ncbi:MAG TPA: hypothetical protein VFK38_02995 [Candidatus Limnocylindrales bacterium]|nr:hypothetical protein [Candidatus Limnocylindrales bacterium]
MHEMHEISRALHAQRVEALRASAQRERLARGARRHEGQSIRRAIGASIIRLGERIAAEHAPRPARSL